MNPIPLPALDGRLPLGFLTAVGAHRLLDAASTGEPRPRLSWDPLDATAVLHVDADLDGAVAVLQEIATSIPEGALLPDGPVGFPAAERLDPEWPRGDPMRMPVEHFRTQVLRWREELGSEIVDKWVPAMVTDLVADDQGCVDTTPFAAPSGQQKFFTMFDKTLDVVRKDPGVLDEALRSWRRVEGVTGEYLDHKVLRSAADRVEGRSIEVGVPGATWLALMAFPWFPVWGHRGRALAGGWQRRPRRSPLFVWPLWSDPIDADGVQTLITHPALGISVGEEGPQVDMARLRPMSVFLACAADRRPIDGRNFAGVLTPTQLILGPRDPRSAGAPTGGT